MRAARIVAPGHAVVEDAPIPEPKEEQVRIRISGCGVCSSNLGPWGGLPWTKYPLEPGDGGHESWGVIDALGPGVHGLELGDRVAAISYRAYAEYDVAGANAVVRLPRELWDVPFPGEAYGCAMNIFRRANVLAGSTVAVVGVGFLGALVVRLASAAGARVIGISRRESSLALARRMGASHVVPESGRSEVVRAVEELTGGELCDRVFELVGKQEPLDLAGELTGTRGTLVIGGYHQDGERRVNMQLWNWRGLDVINAHERELARYTEGVAFATEAVAALHIDPAELSTHSYPLERLGDALDATLTKPDGFVKAIVVP
ncbi:MAG TPA: zinc-binding dehydrogenase [Polyangiaceae bacterium]|jgi:threonine dehydrogenase-like Zn-dependent dehydrogenase|nr:zinc-binding dehydrogenase [Polyangiaceae bacterium]